MFLAKLLREIFFPNKCIACRTRGIDGVICAPCLASIPLHDSLFCGLCHARLGGQKRICHPKIPYLLGTAGNYHEPILQNLILALKFKRRRAAADALGRLLFNYYQRAGLDLSTFTIIPLPLSKRRERERGFNQSELIARSFAARTDLPILNDILIRIRHAQPQSNIHGAKERHQNVIGAFAVAPQTILPKNIILIDDVTTSGATLTEAARALKSAGAKRIIAMAVAIA